jgi:hypothetical protein
MLLDTITTTSLNKLNTVTVIADRNGNIFASWTDQLGGNGQSELAKLTTCSY